ncbi:crotonobetainyl-CoA:carnitine CoA-transferase CaiB-like acyl-CoA transferase [Thermocatellispora tengchongensis]|uniref:Crotonobetainyl-CoA:carnitine CoA-transferase CaiB-like acyl-CoA transferase n=1 Tax=Thermocatellispora tengchongensis TaxID=1073253 RepID=A0A840PMV6_9ACTN|nr:CoA transferase [Thermocatellispora tengchongensis]MBB5137375.1 crotonobetainyl-CoA:carnitine CoA-transferase CaiB-like acyl-CoA transferase [Thermocatellispora tengchongensis]
MEGIRVLEVAQFTFVPSAGAVLADWGADVIKVEHAEKGDAQRGLVKALGHDVVSKGSSFAPIMDGPNRGKRSIGLSLEKPEATRVLHELIRTSDVFLTNFLPRARAKLGIDIDDVRAVNPGIIYAAGTAFAHSGPEADKGGYDGTAFWARGGSADTATPPGAEHLVQQPGGAYGDNIGGMTIAGGIAAALFARERTGHAATVDISLLGVGAWASQLNVNLALMAGAPLPKFDPRDGNVSNPLTGTYRTADGRWLSLVMLQPGRYWPEFCERVGRPELAADERFDSAGKLMANAREAAGIVAEIVAGRTKDEWVAAFDGMEGQWAVVQNTFEVGHDPALRHIGQIAEVVDADGVVRRLVANPVQFDREPPRLTRGPLFAEHTDEILGELGITGDELLNLKIAGAVT